MIFKEFSMENHSQNPVLGRQTKMCVSKPIFMAKNKLNILMLDNFWKSPKMLENVYFWRKNSKTFENTLFKIFIFCPKIQLWFPEKIVDFFGWKTRENVEVLDFLAVDNFDFTRKIVKKIWVKNSWKCFKPFSCWQL